MNDSEQTTRPLSNANDAGKPPTTDLQREMRSLFQNVQNNVMVLVGRVEQLEKQVATIERLDLEGQPLTDELADKVDTLVRAWPVYENTVLVLDQRLSALESCGGSSTSTADGCFGETRCPNDGLIVANGKQCSCGWCATRQQKSISRSYLKHMMEAETQLKQCQAERDVAVGTLNKIETLLAKHWSDEA